MPKRIRPPYCGCNTTPYRLNGEIDKGGHPYFTNDRGEPKPDFFVHVPGTGDNYAVMKSNHPALRPGRYEKTSLPSAALRTSATAGPSTWSMAPGCWPQRLTPDSSDDLSVLRQKRVETPINVLLVSLFAAAAMVLAASGLYGLLSFVVGQRTAEVGVRMALGASGLQILREVLAQGVRLAGAGILIGLFASLALARLMSTLLFGVHPNDPFVLGAMTCMLLGVAVLATSVPAWRASKVEPLTALRTE